MSKAVRKDAHPSGTVHSLYDYIDRETQNPHRNDVLVNHAKFVVRHQELVRHLWVERQKLLDEEDQDDGA